MTREEKIAQAEQRRLEFVAWMADRNEKLTAINNTRAYWDISLLSSTPIWQREKEEIDLFNKLLNRLWRRDVISQCQLLYTDLQQFNPFGDEEVNLSLALLEYIRDDWDEGELAQ